MIPSWVAIDPWPAWTNRHPDLAMASVVPIRLCPSRWGFSSIPVDVVVCCPIRLDRVDLVRPSVHVVCDPSPLDDRSDFLVESLAYTGWVLGCWGDTRHHPRGWVAAAGNRDQGGDPTAADVAGAPSYPGCNVDSTTVDSKVVASRRVDLEQPAACCPSAHFLVLSALAFCLDVW